jgi:hypothetical protein
METEWFGATILFFTLIAILVAANDYDFSQPDEHLVAEHVCSKNDGYAEYGFSYFRHYKYRCNDGAVFKRKNSLV